RPRRRERRMLLNSSLREYGNDACRQDTNVRLPSLQRFEAWDAMSSSNLLSPRAEELYTAIQERIHRHTDYLFGRLLVIQWLAGIAIALWISPRAWVGTSSHIHPHVWAAVVLGGVMCSFPLFLIWKWPGHAWTRQAVAIGQMFTSALLIHLTGGRIETHFHI